MAAGDARVPGGKGLLGGKLPALKQRLLFVIGALVVYRVGTHIPVPGIDPVALAEMFKQTQGSIVDLFNMFSGGALERFSVLALGVMPYISASIIMQLMTTVVPRLTGPMFSVWRGERVPERGIGNGISLIIFAGIVAGLPSAIGGTLELARTGGLQAAVVIALVDITVAGTRF